MGSGGGSGGGLSGSLCAEGPSQSCSRWISYIISGPSGICERAEVGAGGRAFA